MVEKGTKRILSLRIAPGKMNDLKLLEKYRYVFSKATKIMVDRGYTGIKKIFKNAIIGKKSSKNIKLTEEEKKQNRIIARERIENENVIGILKKFRILSGKYRNRRKRMGLRANIIAGIVNYEYCSKVKLMSCAKAA